MTNRQWMESLSDEEFAKWHVEIGCGSCVHNPERGYCKNLTKGVTFESDYCTDGMAKWLKMEHKGDNK